MLFTWVKKINGPVEYNDNYRDKITDMAFNRKTVGCTAGSLITEIISQKAPRDRGLP